MTCTHQQFDADVRVARLEDIGAFMAEVRIKCLHCGVSFQFLGLPAGCMLNGATVSLDGLEANLAICPQGAKPSPMQVVGYTITGSGPGPAGHN